jgi:hypothetical protein
MDWIERTVNAAETGEPWMLVEARLLRREAEWTTPLADIMGDIADALAEASVDRARTPEPPGV